MDANELANPPAGGVTGFVPKLSVKPKGTPAAVRPTGNEKLPTEVIVTVAVPIVLGPSTTLAGETMMLKSPDEITFNVNVVECVTVPFDPVMVSP